MKKKKILLASAVLVLAVAVVFAAIVYIPVIRARIDVDYIPPAFRKLLFKEVEITEDMTVPIEMIQAVLALPEEERMESNELKILNRRFDEVIAQMPEKMDTRIGSAIEYGLPSEYAFIRSKTDNSQGYIAYLFSNKMLRSIWWHYYEDGTFGIHVITQHYGIRYIITNNTNGELRVYKTIPQKAQALVYKKTT